MSRLRNCPYCFGRGSHGHTSRCGFCYGKKRVSEEYCKWYTKRDRFEQRKRVEIEEDLEIDIVQKRLAIAMDKFDKKNPKPKKF